VGKEPIAYRSCRPAAAVQPLATPRDVTCYDELWPCGRKPFRQSASSVLCFESLILTTDELSGKTRLQYDVSSGMGDLLISCVLYVSLTAVVSGESGDDIYEQLKVVIEEQTGPTVWVSTNQPL